MTGQLTNKPDTDFIRNFDLLIKKIMSGQTDTTVDFVLLLHSFIAEVRKTGARNLIIAASYNSPIFEHKIKTWAIQYILPQMQSSGIKRIAFVMQEKATGQNEIIHIPKKDFEVGLFNSISAATAWIMDLSFASGRSSTCNSPSLEHCPQYPL